MIMVYFKFNFKEKFFYNYGFWMGEKALKKRRLGCHRMVLPRGVISIVLRVLHLPSGLEKERLILHMLRVENLKLKQLFLCDQTQIL